MTSKGGIGKRILKTVKKSWAGWLFVLPLVLGLAIFTFYPMVMSFIYSLYHYDGVGMVEDSVVFRGFGNYIEAFTADQDLMFTIPDGNGGTMFNRNSVFYTTFRYAVITIPINLVLSYLLAVLLNRKTKGIGVFRLLIYLPCIIPGVVSGLIWRSAFDPAGLVNYWLDKIGVDVSGLTWFRGETTAFPTLIITGLWGLGGSMILWLSSLKNIPDTVYEAARLDGAGPFTRLIKITVPMSTSMIFYNLITGIIGALQTFSTYTLGLGKQSGLYLYAVKIYEEAFNTASRYGYASALSWILFAVIGVLTLLIFRTSKWVYYGEES